MISYFRDYLWKSGKPIGVDILTQPHEGQICYKIVSDPYHKRISVEQYRGINYDSVVYDSAFLDFRKLSEEDQLAWEKEVIHQEGDRLECLIRNQDDRVVIIEKHLFKDQIPIECRLYSPQGVFIALQKIHYVPWGDPFNGVTLSDSTGRVVLKKIYELDPQRFEFTQLISENS